jgi:hypothetical protein
MHVAYINAIGLRKELAIGDPELTWSNVVGLVEKQPCRWWRSRSLVIERAHAFGATNE